MGVNHKIARKLRRAPYVDLSVFVSLKKGDSKRLLTNTAKLNEAEKVLLANFLLIIKKRKLSHYKDNIFLKIPRNEVKNLKGNRFKLSDYLLTKTINTWKEAGLIGTYKGYSWWGKVRPNSHFLTEKGFDFINSFNPTLRHGVMCFVNVGGAKEALASSRFRVMNKDLREYNKLLNGSDITYYNNEAPYFHYKRIFNQTPNLGGRLIDSIQRVPRILRDTILFKKTPSFEIDFISCHIQLSYIQSGEIIPETLFIPTDEFSEDEMKRAALIMLNTASRAGAAMAIFKSQEKDLLKKLKKHIKSQKLSSPRVTALRAGVLKGMEKDLKIITLIKERENLLARSHKLVKIVEAQHPLLRNQFFNKEALTLQKMESDLCMEIISRATDSGIPLISIHDSFIGPVDKREEILEIIRDSALKIHGQSLQVSSK